MTLEEIIQELSRKLNYDKTDLKFHEDSILAHGEICYCPQGLWCEHRYKWMINYLKAELRKLEPED